MKRVQQKVRKTRILTESIKFRDALTTYSNVFGSLPMGEFPAMIVTLSGQNPSNIVFIDLDPEYIDTAGRYVDYWRTPYRIELTVSNSLILGSAGPNRAFGDGDDIVVEQPLMAAGTLPMDETSPK
jgi:hypothetical protein